MSCAFKGDWVKIHKIVLKPEERAPQVPNDTKKVPLEMWVKGFLVNETASIGDEVTVCTYIGREIRGILVEKNPSYCHGFGNYVPELSYIGKQLRAMLESGDNHD